MRILFRAAAKSSLLFGVALVELFIWTSSPGPISGQENSFEKAKPAWTLKWDVDWVTAVCFVGDNRVAAGNNLGEILVWELPTDPKAEAPKPSRRLAGHSNVINRMLRSPDGRWLYSASNDHTIRVWDLQGSAVRKDKVVLNLRPIYEAESRKKKAPAPIEATVDVQESAKVLEGHQDWVLGLSMSKDGAVLATGDDKGEILIWDRPADKIAKRWKTKGWIWALALSPDADLVVASERLPLVFDSGRHTAVKTWDPKTGEAKADWTKQVNKQMIGSAAFSPDGKIVALGRGGEADASGGGKVTLYNVADGKQLKELTPGHMYGITDLLFHPNGEHLISTGRDTMVRIYDVKKGTMVKELGQARGGQFKDWYHAISLSPDGRLLAAADMAGQVQVWTLR